MLSQFHSFSTCSGVLSLCKSSWIGPEVIRTDKVLVHIEFTYTVMHIIMTFWSKIDCIYDAWQSLKIVIEPKILTM